MQGWTSATECSVTHWRQSDSRKTHPAATAVAAGCAACLGLANKTHSNKMFSSFFLFLIGVQTFFSGFFVPSRKPKELFSGLVCQAENQKNFSQACCGKHKTKRTSLRLFVPSRKPKEKTKQRRTRLPAERGHSRTSIETKKRRGKHFDARLDVCH